MVPIQSSPHTTTADQGFQASTATAGIGAAIDRKHVRRLWTESHCPPLRAGSLKRQVYNIVRSIRNGRHGAQMKVWLRDARFWGFLIFAFLAAVGLERGAYRSANSDPHGSSAVLQYVVLFCLVGYWLNVDSRERRTVQVWDMGFFLYIAWPVIVPYYLVKTRGLKRAAFTSLLFIADYLGASVAGMTLFRTVR